MYVCLCQAVTDKQIKQAAENGANHIRDLKRDLGVASVCGKCACQARKVLQDTHAEQAALYYEVA
ncbi:bacterioferritin-associated ferredoxin [Paraferrimonas sedimenticola]|uniref:Bacterioferritin-associated ferredoxin n=1 Tax=Paraferrimonas sedimenticola TaxID=375674 RepID=A0AA37RZ10_9GAMM|nr:bacterioferritin-associated ferredoxin [Paraferrimonas sedimenticola]GLP97382.1 bacterioferritin-associated ferredoxin [Paraferrimonas sedimenticola]